MHRLAHVVKAFFCALGVYLVVFLLVIEYDPWVSDFIEQKVCERLSIFGDCRFSARVHSCSLLRGSLVLHDVVVQPKAGTQWKYTIDELCVSWPVLPLITNRICAFHAVCSHADVFSHVNAQGLALQEHVRACLANKPQYFAYKPTYVRVHTARFTGQSIDQACTGTVDVTVDMVNSPSVQKTAVSFKDGSVTLHGKPLLTGATGVTKYHLAEGHHHATLDCQTSEHFVCRAQATDGHLDFSLFNRERTISVTGQCDESLRVLIDAHADLFGTMRSASATIDTRDHMFSLVGPEQVHLTGRWSQGAQDFTITGTTADGFGVDVRVGERAITGTGTYQDGVWGTFACALSTGAYTAHLKTSALATLGLIDPRVGIDGECELSGRVGKPWTGHVAVRDSHIRLPHTYLFLPEVAFDVQLNQVDKSVRVTDLLCTTQQGRVSCSSATVRYDNQRLTFVHAPLSVHDLFVHKGSDFYATLSGDLLVTGDRAARSSIKGHGIIDQCHVRENIFSPGVKQDLVRLPHISLVPMAGTTDLDIALSSKTPCEVKTSFLHALCMLNVQIRGTIAQPELYGDIDCVEGKLMFPYQPMHIVQGKIFFVDNQLADPLIEITARAQIKHYTILLQISGTAQQPTITFQSSPYLQDEQIISLLFGGVEDGAVAVAMPLSLSNSLERLVLGSADESSQVLSGLERILKPFSNVRIVPSFSDQSARGGVRGALRVEVNDRLSGLIQQNFSLTEDTLIEAAYKVTDNVTIRGMRDERGDLGGEVEVSLKW